jgi:hypothetical protein
MDDNPSASLIDLYRRLKRRGNWMIIVTMLVLLALAVFASPAQRTPLPIPRPENRLGIHLLLDDGRNAWPEVLWPEHIELLRSLFVPTIWTLKNGNYSWTCVQSTS